MRYLQVVKKPLILAIQSVYGLKRRFRTMRRRKYLSLYPTSGLGSVEWLIGTENKYGGVVTNVRIKRVSPRDPRTKEQIQRRRMVGGDRMLDHGYAKKYSEYLLPYVVSGRPVTLAEIGILKGTGLAIWCDLFSNGRILGFDIDLGHIHGNMDNLLARGAFHRNAPELHEFDQFADNVEYLEAILKDDKVDICIDDGFHSCESILNTMRSIVPYLATRFVYFVEDNKSVHKQIKLTYPEFDVENSGSLTVISRT